MTSLAHEYRQQVGVPHQDTLTGLYTHGVFSLFVAQEIERAARYGNPFSLGALSVDHFSGYNQRHGPISGDLALKTIAQAIADGVRTSDVAARLMGDVFAVLFAEVPGRKALAPMERILTRIRERFDGQLTMSAGLVDWQPDLSTESDLIERALQALHTAKHQGRDTIVSQALQPPEGPSGEAGRVLIVDDDPKNVKLLEAMLHAQFPQNFKAHSGQEALRVLVKEAIDVVLLDVMMPGMDGFEVCRRIRSNPDTRLLPVILVTALDDSDAKIKGLQAGANDFLTKPPNRQELIARTGSLVQLRKVTSKLAGIENVLFSLARSIEAKDPYTKGHTERVANIAFQLGQRLNLSPDDLESLRYGGYLHDIGKIGTPMEVLHKPGKLDASEWQTIKKHPMDGYRIALPLHHVFGKALDVVRYHHERMDGSGYPEGLSGEKIPLLARILAVADAFDAMTTDRPYRSRMAVGKTMEILRAEVDQGKLDPAVVAALIDMVRAEAGEQGSVTSLVEGGVPL